MPDWIVNLAGSWLGLKTLWDKIDGYKTYMSGVGQMMTGFGLMLGGAAAETDAFIANTHNFAEAVKFVLALYQHPDAPALGFLGGWGVVLMGWHVIAKKHAEDKALAAAGIAAAPPASAPPAAS